MKIVNVCTSPSVLLPSNILDLRTNLQEEGENDMNGGTSIMPYIHHEKTPKMHKI